MWVKIRNTLGPLLLTLLCPPFVMLMWYTNTQLDGSFSNLWSMMSQTGVFSTLYTIWQPLFWGSSTAWIIIGIFVVFELVLMRILPGKTFYGPITPKGNVPVYKANGVLAFVTSIAAFSIASFGLNLFPATILYDNLGSLFAALNISSLLFCVLLYIKGRFAPSSSDASTTNNLIFDYYWGTELYPQFLGWSIKKFITCRFGMMSWGILLLSYCAKQAELGGLTNSLLISVALQLIYIAKFFAWETGYLRSLDIMHDRAGFYICWGCMVWVPCIYTSPSMYLVLHPINLSFGWASLIFVLGTTCIMINYLADKQRIITRETQGNCRIWGKKPKTLEAHYKTELGKAEKTLLLASGWWGIARHFHYVPEIAAAFFWSVPALFTNLSPYFYVCFLTILLIDRAFRDDKRCSKKYGADWVKYCDLVPYKIVPLIL
ncbi:7-dehydrocholesterol reductase [Legionella bononiensis]|uniref:7-dehydrocholesterol reductase n=1 Tax=Legionella bononiensis TaxID=2793102 RepID=A0ABS1W6W9_9GAMM|nr:7-dehydrocholesterol reductase [Legionella bononiensis]MBL7525102.1 7-dehydrocholesterol reductase [Legionella bononiensis]MBL7562827.1 7-dehydrocholesterol reductase [Legionella bononiensis]